MRKYIAIIEGRRIKKFNLSKITLPLTVIRQHLYPTNDRFFHLEKGGDQAIEFTELENPEVYGSGEFENPDEIIAVLDTAPSMKGKVAVWNRLIDGATGMDFIYYALGIIMVIYVIYGMINGAFK